MDGAGSIDPLLELLAQRHTPASLPAAVSARLLKRRKDFVHLVITGHHRARGRITLSSNPSHTTLRSALSTPHPAPAHSLHTDSYKTGG